MKPFFASLHCPDFGAAQAPVHLQQRPFGCDTQCGKLLAALEAGERLTTLKAISLTGGTEAARRLREVRAYLTTQGRELQEERVTTDGGASIKRYWLNV